jgi:hypothetical protein
MTEPSYALQMAILAALKGNTDAGSAVFDILQPNTFPRVSIGQGQPVPDDSSGVDGFNVAMQIDAWSKSPTYAEVKKIAGQIHDILHKKSLAVAGYNLVDMWSEGAVFSRDDDISRARIMIEAQLEVT